MINPIELRIGNWVNFCGSPKQIEGISVRQRQDVGYYELSGISTPQKGIHLSAITLTEELLLKTNLIKRFLDDGGFIKERDGSRYYAWVDKGVFSLEKQDNGEIWFELYSHYKHIKYVHELQNIYFSLTGEELIIKP